MLHRNLVTEQAGDVSFVGVGHVGIRALADFRQLYPLRSPGLSLPDLPRSVCVAVTNGARPWRARWSAVIFVIAGLPRGQRRGDLAQQGSHQRRQLLPLFRNRRRLMLVHVEQVWPSTRGLLLHAWLPPRSLNWVGSSRKTKVRATQKSPKRVDMVKDGRAANA